MPARPARLAAKSPSATSAGSVSHQRPSSGCRQPTVQGRHSVGPLSAQLVPHGEMQPEAVLLAARLVQPGQRAAEAQVRLDHPLGAASHQPGRGCRGKLPVPPRPDHQGSDSERHRQEHRIAGADQGGERHAGGQPSQRAARGPRASVSRGVRLPRAARAAGAASAAASAGAAAASFAGAAGPQPRGCLQVQAHGGERADRHPEVGHGLRAVILGSPQAAEDQPGEHQHPSGPQPPPGQQCQEQAQARGHGQVSPQCPHG